jgi:CheY-like chemotaxis protein
MPDLQPHVLIADDDREMRAYIRHVLRNTARVTEAADGAEALGLALQEAPDLVIADVRMPGLDGYALCAALHDDATTSAVPVLLVSGEASPSSACASAFLAKPFNASGLRAAVALLLPDGTLPSRPSAAL